MKVKPKAKPKLTQTSRPKSENPWLSKSVLNATLDLNLCQEIRVFALRQAIWGQSAEMIPDTIPVAELRQLVRRYGPQMLVEDETILTHLFGKVTLAVYQAIETLYCSRLLRSCWMVWRVLQQQARRARSLEISYEAVWTICEYLVAKRARLTEVSCSTDLNPWWLIGLRPDVWIENPGGAPYQPALLCIVQTEPLRILAYWIGPPEQRDEGSLLALYEALVSLRVPAQDGGGLRWQIPAKLLSDLPLNGPFQHACDDLSVDIEPRGNDTSSLLEALRSNWECDLVDRVFTHRQLARLFDTYLVRHHGYGPLRARRENDRRFRWHIGYTREPSWLFPALRSLLPRVPARIAADGSIPFDGFHYVDALLTYWPEQEVTLGLLPETDALVWVYLDGDLLCQAGAAELCRPDGSYRSSRTEE